MYQALKRMKINGQIRETGEMISIPSPEMASNLLANGSIVQITPPVDEEKEALHISALEAKIAELPQLETGGSGKGRK